MEMLIKKLFLEAKIFFETMFQLMYHSFENENICLKF